MRLLYLDFNEQPFEDYSISNPTKYGGGKCVAANLLPYMHANGHYMEIWGGEGNFDNVDPKLKQYCQHIDWKYRKEIGEGRPLGGFVEPGQFDLVLHHNGGMWVNCEGIDTIPLYWAVGYSETVHPGNKNLILYNDFQHPRIQNPDTKIFRARIGVPIPEFEVYKKEPFIFSCHRQSKEFGSELMMQLAHKHKFQYITAGPQDNFHNIKDYIDGKYVIYLGVIDSHTKIEYFKHALCSTYLHSWPTPYNLSACESLSYNTPCISSPVGFWPSFIKNGVNGFIVNSEADFLVAIENCPKLSQKQIYETVLDMSVKKMIDDYIDIFKTCLL